MSAAVDVNVLLYASDHSSEFSRKARAFLDERARSPDLLCLCWMTLMSYLRMATHTAIFSHPLTPAEANANIEAIVRLPQTRILHEDTGFWEAYLEVTKLFPIRGNLVPDAHLATILRQHGIKTLYTADRDFKKFAFLEVKNPVA